jgi:hypothetical protein
LRLENINNDTARRTHDEASSRSKCNPDFTQKNTGLSDNETTLEPDRLKVWTYPSLKPSQSSWADIAAQRPKNTNTNTAPRVGLIFLRKEELPNVGIKGGALTAYAF